jgi:hypothetical protein
LSGFILGQYLPLEYLRPKVNKVEISLNDLYLRVTTSIGTIVTSFAVIVALFKEDIRRIWESASLTVCFRDENSLAEIFETENSKQNSQNVNLSAKKYESILSISNIGNLTAKNCEIYLERLQYKTSLFPSKQELSTTGLALNWIGKEDHMIAIPSKAKSTVCILEIQSSLNLPVSSSTNTGDNKPRIKIGDIDCPVTSNDSTFEAKFMLYSENSKTQEINIEIVWNGKWQSRLTEMSKNITIAKLDIVNSI